MTKYYHRYTIAPQFTEYPDTGIIAGAGELLLGTEGFDRSHFPILLDEMKVPPLDCFTNDPSKCLCFFTQTGDRKAFFELTELCQIFYDRHIEVRHTVLRVHAPFMDVKDRICYRDKDQVILDTSGFPEEKEGLYFTFVEGKPLPNRLISWDRDLWRHTKIYVNGGERKEC